MLLQKQFYCLITNNTTILGTNEVQMCCNYDTANIFSAVDVTALENLLVQSKYDKQKTQFLVSGFKQGFPLHYQGREDVKIRSPNLKFRIGDETILWNKVMKEVEAKRFAGPFENIPFDNYIQSPIGLVPKDGGRAHGSFSIYRIPGGLNHPNQLTVICLSSIAQSDTRISVKQFSAAWKKVKICVTVQKAPREVLFINCQFCKNAGNFC